MRKTDFLLRIPLLVGVLLVLPSIVFGVWQDSDFEFRAFVSSVHVEDVSDLSNSFNLTGTALNYLQDCSYVEFYDNDNTTQLNYALIDWLSINGTQCFYKVLQTSDEGFWLMVGNNTTVSSRSSLDGTVLHLIVNESGQVQNALSDVYSGGIAGSQTADYLFVEDIAGDGGNTTTQMFGNGTRNQGIFIFHQSGSTGTSAIVYGYNPAGIGTGSHGNVYITTSTKQVQSDAGTTAMSPAPSTDTAYFWEMGKNGTAVWGVYNGSKTIRYTNINGGVSDSGFYQGQNAETFIYMWYVENCTINGTDPYMIVGAVHSVVSSEVDFKINAHTYDTPVQEISLHDFGLILSWNESVINNVSLNHFTYNNTDYSSTDFNVVSGADGYSNSTWNYTNFTVPILEKDNNTVNAFVWNWTVYYVNMTNATMTNSTDQTVYWSLWLNSSMNISNVLGGDSVNFSSSVNNESSIGGTIDGWFDLNGTNTSFTANYWYVYHYPEVLSDEWKYYQTWFNVTYSGIQTTRNHTNNTFTLYTYEFDDCSTYTSVLLNVSTVWEDNDTLVPVDIEMQVKSGNRQWNISYPQNESALVCATPVWLNLTADLDIYFDDMNLSHYHLWRRHFLRSVRMDNNTYSVTLRVNDSSTTEIEVPVDDGSGYGRDYLLICQKINWTDNTYYTVAMDNTTDISSGFFNIECPYNYRFVVMYNNGTTAYASSGRYVDCNSPADEVEFSQASTSDFFTRYGSVDYAVTDIDSLNRTVLTINSITGTDITVYLNVSMNDDYLCSKSGTSSGLQLRCELGNYTNNIYFIQVIVEDSGGFTQIYTSTLDYKVFLDYGEDALIGALIIILIVGLMAMKSPVVSIVFTIAGLGLLMITEFLQISRIAFVGIVVIGIVTIYAMIKDE